MDTLILPATACTRGVAGGSLCPRPAEVQVHLVSTATGETNRKNALCAVHAFELVPLAFRDSDRPDRELLTVILAPL